MNLDDMELARRWARRTTLIRCRCTPPTEDAKRAFLDHVALTPEQQSCLTAGLTAFLEAQFGSEP